MAEDTARKFVEALGKEDNRHATDARAFWQSYRDNFDEVKSVFHNQIVTENQAFVEIGV